jgi:hypothetical protein
MTEDFMASQVEAHMSTGISPHRNPLYGGLIVTLSAVLTAAVGFAAIYVLNRGILPTFLVPVSAAGIGLVAGFMSRWTLHEHSYFTRWLVAMVGVCFGLAFIGWLSHAKIGFDFNAIARERPDWYGLAQIALGGFVAWLSVRAWSRIGIPSASDDHAVLVSANRGATSTPVSVEAARGDVRAWRRRIRPHSARITPSLPVRPTARPGRRNFIRRRVRAKVRLAAAVEHRCPYCLDLVDPSDPKGVNMCSICHTLHHADCWAVTGSCQVPHHQ